MKKRREQKDKLSIPPTELQSAPPNQVPSSGVEGHYGAGATTPNVTSNPRLLLQTEIRRGTMMVRILRILQGSMMEVILKRILRLPPLRLVWF